jgi:hypothetical protein
MDARVKPAHDKLLIETRFRSAGRPDPTRARLRYACPASLESMPRSMPIFFSAFSYLPLVS